MTIIKSEIQFVNNSAQTIVNPGMPSGILFLHGFLGDAKEFRDIGRDFEKTHTVIYADLPGHGSHQITSQCATFESIVEDYAQLLSKQRTKDWHVVGYSMGGRLALFLACKWPQLIQRMTLISASPGLESVRERTRRIYSDRHLANKLRRGSMREILGEWYRQPLFEFYRRSAKFAETLLRRQSGNPIQLASALDVMGLGKQPSLWGELTKLKMPTELICGERDLKFCQIANRMRQANPSLNVTHVAQCGHVVHLEAVNLVKARLKHVDSRLEKRKRV